MSTVSSTASSMESASSLATTIPAFSGSIVEVSALNTIFFSTYIFFFFSPRTFALSMPAITTPFHIISLGAITSRIISSPAIDSTTDILSDITTYVSAFGISLISAYVLIGPPIVCSVIIRHRMAAVFSCFFLCFSFVPPVFSFRMLHASP